ncbi:MAG TPA: efflux transporter periplasmic adaptor subunit [Sulfurospirillum sp. UBA12182]|jgi:membrane fusion protein (multidrug efflux system)|nr:MAG TPA: efflux transporter periplasmic adaptor subunit [Sulfurospirillum sp. UBA12182]
MKKFKQIIAISLLFGSINSFANPQGTPPLPKADVYVVPQAKDMALTLSYPAQIYSFRGVNVVARVSGVLEEKFFEEGSFVEKGQKLYKIEDTIYKAKVDAAQASVGMAEAVLNNATRVWNRTKELYAKKAVSQESRDNALSAYEQAVASLALAKANLNQAKVDLEYTNVKAPISGVVGLKLVDVGDYVSASAGTNLVSITQNDVVNVEFSMPLSDYMNIKNGIWSLPQDNKIKVSLIIDDKPVQKSGVIDFIDINANKNTATVKMRAVIDNSDKYLIPGSFARVVTEDIYQKDVISVPQKAVLQNPLGTVVFVEKDGVVGVKPVKVANESKDLFILKQGAVQSGDRVILNNFFRIKPGSQIAVDKVVNE